MVPILLLLVSATAQDHLVESVRIGAAIGGAAYDFYRVVAINVTPAGEIVVANGGTSEFRVFGPNGGHVRTFGGRGGGPNEFESLAAAFFRDGVIHVPGSNVLRVVDLKGELVRTEQQLRPGIGQNIRIIGVGDGGHVVRVITSRACPPGPEPCGPPVNIEWFDTETGVSQKVAAFTDLRMARLPFEAPQRGVFLASPLFEAAPAVGVDGSGNIYMTSPDRYQVDVLSRTGLLVRRITRSHRPRPIPSAQLERVRTCLLDVSAQARGIAERRIALPRRETLPVITGLLVGKDGSVWLKRGDMGAESADALCNRDSASFTWDRFDEAGRYLGSVQMPDSLRPMHLMKDVVFGVERDQDNVEIVVGYRVTSTR